LSVRILAWNLGHQTREAPIPGALTFALGEIAPDVLVLNEFVDGPTRIELRANLAALGLMHVAVSHRVGRHNQVLIAARQACGLGEMTGPELDGGAGQSNFLHVRFGGLDVVGLRAPSYNGSELVEYWDRLRTLILQTGESSIVWIGDMNADPDRPEFVGGRVLADLRANGWNVPRAEGESSFLSGSRIDHAIVSTRVQCVAAQYVTTLGDQTLVGRLSSTRDYISDHAGLLVEVRENGEPDMPARERGLG
jgi:hypothetical protein